MTDHNQPQSEAHAATQLEFLKIFIAKADSDVPKAGLSCPLCVIDPTISSEFKSTKYSLSKLNAHLTSKTHTRKEQLKRALKADNSFPVF